LKEDIRKAQENRTDTLKGPADTEGKFKIAEENQSLIPNDSLQKPVDSLQIEPDKSIIDERVDYNAEDSIIFDAKNKIIHLYKNAVLLYGTIELKAHYIRLDMNSKTLHAESE